MPNLTRSLSWSRYSSLIFTRKRHRSLPRFARGFFLARNTVLPPKYRPKDKHHKIDPGDHHPLAPRDVDLPLSLLPLVTDLQESLWVIRNHTVEFPFYTPFHHGFLVDRPYEQWPPFRFHIANEARSKTRYHEGLLQHIEGNVRNREKFARVRYAEPDMRYGKGGEVFRAERKELDGPAPED